MKAGTLILAMVLGLTLGVGQAATAVHSKERVSYSATVARGNTTVTVRLKMRSFDRNRHRIYYKNQMVYVDGQRAVGFDDHVPAISEIESMDIVWNGKHVPLPRIAYAPIYDVNSSLTGPCPDNVERVSMSLALDDSQERILVRFALGDACRIDVLLVIARDGSWHRFSADEMS